MNPSTLFLKIYRNIRWRAAQLWFRINRRGRADRVEEWRDLHQGFELDFHRHRNFRWNDEAFFEQWNQVFQEFMGLTPDAFDDSHCLLDVGCGSRPALDWFDAAPKKFYLDPLLDQYRQIPEVKGFWEQEPADSLLSTPAEEYHEFLADRCDFILCWNVLDHTFDWEHILENLASYAKQDSLVCLSTDFPSHGPGHPGIEDSARFYDLIGEYFGVERRREGYLGRDVALKLRRK